MSDQNSASGRHTHSASPLSTESEQLALLIASVREYAIYMLDTAGLVASWNPGAERIKGYAPGDIIGKHYAIFFTSEDQAANKPWRLLEEAQRRGQAQDDGWRVRHDGTRFWASATITAIRDASHCLRGFAKVVRDETERHALEEKTRNHAAELERIVAERTRELREQAQDLRRTNHELEQFNVAVGTLVAQGPPHRSVRAQLTHTAPTSSIDDKPLVWEWV